MIISGDFTALGPDIPSRSRRGFGPRVYHKFPTLDDLRGGGGLAKSAPISDLPAPPDSSGGRWRIIRPDVSILDNRIIVATIDEDIFQAFWSNNKTADAASRTKAKLKGVASWVNDYPRIQRPNEIDETSYQILKAELRALHQAEGYTLLSLGESSSPPFVNNVLCRALIGLHKEGIHPVLCDVDKDLIESFEVKKIDKLFPLYESQEAAVKALQAT